jgi:uncharacterized protein YndB with AHSA1/START domain
LLVAVLLAAQVGFARQKDHAPPAAPETRSVEVVVLAPPEVVYRYLTDEDLIERWGRDDDVTVTFPKGRETRVGKQVRIDLDLPTHPWLLMEIRELEPGRRVATEFVGGALAGTFSYELTPASVGDIGGGTRIVHRMAIRGVGWVYRVLWDLVGWRLHARRMQGFLERLKAVVEGDRPASASASAAP